MILLLNKIYLLSTEEVQTFPAQDDGSKTPSLPKFKTPTFSSHRHGANPALAMNLLQEIQETCGWLAKRTAKNFQQIQDIYLEGPIVNGWLESNPQEPEHRRNCNTASCRS